MASTATKLTAAIEPFLLQFATSRSGEAQGMAGHYCGTRQLWVVEVQGVSRPIVQEAGDLLAQTLSKTMTQVEADDDDQGRGAMAQIVTVTETRQEADDRDAAMMLPELLTKTDVRQETDDQADCLV